LKENSSSVIGIISLVAAVVAAAVSVWAAFVSVDQYKLALRLAKEQRFVSIAFEIGGDCKARLGPLPDQAHLQQLGLIYGEYEHPQTLHKLWISQFWHMEMNPSTSRLSPA
jgi:hypothetical protein